MSSRKVKKGAVDIDNDTQSPDLYSEFGINKTASEDEIKKAYRKLALKYHPDKLSTLSTDTERQTATAKFQQIATWYSVLSDPAKRKRYDATGEIDTDGATMFTAKGDATWDEYFRALYTELVPSEIDKFSKQYRESEEERADILKAYKTRKGHIFNILDTVMLATLDDFPRFISIIQSAIDANEVPLYPLFTKTSQDKKELAKRKKAAEEEAKEVKQGAKMREKTKKGKEKGAEDDGEDALRALIMARQSGRMESLISGLQERYVGKKGNASEKGSKRRKVEEVEEEEEEEDMDGDSEEGDWEDVDDEDGDEEDVDEDEEEDGVEEDEVRAPKASAAKKQAAGKSAGNTGKATTATGGKRKR
ncbi:hypothetical protein HK097_005280 [Rhizophlyctis rosea]|uniref:J domain-containing protein n=1 Tax=Rhizophlyctis rosea TaxID=64517 RepID=A0AAD5SDE5_9FUNG|nr:hypothetical protein HK097_005280 [Rhizophlyctis rosea]